MRCCLQISKSHHHEASSIIDIIASPSALKGLFQPCNVATTRTPLPPSPHATAMRVRASRHDMSCSLNFQLRITSQTRQKHAHVNAQVCRSISKPNNITMNIVQYSYMEAYECVYVYTYVCCVYCCASLCLYLRIYFIASYAHSWAQHARLPNIKRHSSKPVWVTVENQIAKMDCVTLRQPLSRALREGLKSHQP